MKKLIVAAALLMATTAAHAGDSVSFEIQGHKIHIAAPKGCDSLSCIQISAPSLSGFKGIKSNHDADVAERTDPPAPAPEAAAPQPSTADAGRTPATVAPAAPAPMLKDDIVTAAPPAAPTPSTVAPAAATPAVVAATPAQAPTTPLGVWATEDNKGRVRVEQCGQNICGFAADTNEKILINMKPSDAKWVGHIHDPDSGRTYDSTIAMKGPNTLRVQGCAFGGLFCGGQTWSRVS